MSLKADNIEIRSCSFAQRKEQVSYSRLEVIYYRLWRFTNNVSLETKV